MSLAKFLYKDYFVMSPPAGALRECRNQDLDSFSCPEYLDHPGKVSPQQFALHLSRAIHSQITGQREMGLKRHGD